MARYTIQDPNTGRTVTLEGDSPPTEAELEQVFQQVNAGAQPQQQQQSGNVLQNFINNLRSVQYVPEATQQLQQATPAQRFGQAAKNLLPGGPLLQLLTTPQGQFSQTGMGAAGELASVALPGMIPAVGSPITTGILRGGAAGALHGATTPNVGIGERLGKTAEETAFGGAVGGALGAASMGLGKAREWISAKAAPVKEKLANQILGLTKKQIKVTGKGGNWLSQQLVDKLDDGTIKPGNYQSIRDQAVKQLGKSEEQINNLVARSSAKTVELTKFTDQLDDLITKANRQGNTAKANAIAGFKDTLVEQWGEKLSAGDVLQLKRTMDSALSDSMFSKFPSEISAARSAAQRQIGNAARNWLNRSDVIGGEIGDLLKDESIFINLRSAMEQQLARLGRPISTPTSIFSLLNLPVKAGVGAATSPQSLSGAITGGLPGRVATGAQNTLMNATKLLGVPFLGR